MIVQNKLVTNPQPMLHGHGNIEMNVDT